MFQQCMGRVFKKVKSPKIGNWIQNFLLVSILSFFISFDKFQEWTEEALSEFKGMLEDNPALVDLFTDGVVIEKTEEEKTENWVF